jgi:hypothetical protein
MAGPAHTADSEVPAFSMATIAGNFDHVIGCRNPTLIAAIFRISRGVAHTDIALASSIYIHIAA